MMPKISIALIVFAVLMLLFVRLLTSARENRDARPLLALNGLAGLQALLVSLRWDFDIMTFRPLQIAISCLLPALAWLSFRVYSSHAQSVWSWRDGLHLLPAALCLVAVVALPDVIDVIIISVFVGYGIAMLRLALNGENGLARAPLNSIVDLQRALWLITFTMFGSALTDLLVFLDFLRGGGVHAPMLVGMGNLASLVAIAVAAVFGSGSIADVETEEAVPEDLPSNDDAAVVEAAEKVLRDGGLAKDPNLTLNRLARRMGLPARNVSRAVNLVKKRNVSQFVNDVRVAEACRLLENRDVSITQVIYDSGFQTKSNFNREFLRVMGKSPREWRSG
jgi:AraC-like DNA-binding protein